MARQVPLERVRNIGIIAHIDAGKTTLTEMILYHTGRTYKVGQVDEGTAVMDWMDQERERGITITAAATSCQWLGHQINIIDTPGHVDFTAEVERSLRVLDGGIVLFDGVEGVESQSEMVWRQADRYNVPRICFVNKMDRVGADFWNTMKMMRERLRANPVPIQIPLGVEASFSGIIDLVEEKALVFPKNSNPMVTTVPEDKLETFEQQRKALLESVAEADDDFLLSYLEGEFGAAQLKAALRRATISGRLVPVLCGSALRDKGIQPLLDAVVDYLPSPLDIPPIRGFTPGSKEEITRRPDDEEPFTALAFKVVTDPFVGRLVYLRVYSGQARSGSLTYNSSRGVRERLGRLLRMHANYREEVEEARTGDIIAATGLKNTLTGDTLSDPHSPIVLEAIRFPEPVVSVAVEPKTKADQEKMASALRKLEEEDPTFRVRHDPETGQTLISGVGELQLEVLVTRLLREFRVEARVSRPRVAYKEALTTAVRSEGRFIRQTGGRGQYGHVVLLIEPLEPGAGFQFVDQVQGGVIPREFIPAVEAGAREALETGVLLGCPIVDVRVTLLDGSYHEVDSSEFAFKMAASIAVKEGAKKANPVLLEPIMKLEVTTPQEFLGEVINDLNARRGSVEGIETRDNMAIIKGRFPLAEGFGYATDLRSMSQGRASFFMEFHSYQRVPDDLAREIISRFRGRR
ncbi:MAG: elongation factor G [Chloroflexi bacterium]|nr:MAG: elongation factor G [Chloroflexota bacterium]